MGPKIGFSQKLPLMFKFGFSVETTPINQSKVDGDQPMIAQSKLKKSIFVVKNGLFFSKVTFFGTLAVKQQDLFLRSKTHRGTVECAFENSETIFFES